MWPRIVALPISPFIEQCRGRELPLVIPRAGHPAGMGAALWARLGEARRSWGVVDGVCPGAGADDSQVGQRTSYLCKGKAEKPGLLTRILRRWGSWSFSPSSGRTVGAKLRPPHPACRCHTGSDARGGSSGLCRRWCSGSPRGWWPRANICMPDYPGGGIVRDKARKKVEFGLPELLSRLGGGYVFGTMAGGWTSPSALAGAERVPHHCVRRRLPSWSSTIGVAE